MSEQKPGAQNDQSSPALKVLKEHGVTILIVILVGIFIAQNSDDVPLDVLWMNFTAPLWVTLTVVALLGVAVGWLLKRRSVRRAD